MIFLQAAIAAGYFIIGCYLISLILGVLIFTGFIVKVFWKFAGKQGYIDKGVPNYKDPFALIISILISVILTTIIYFLIVAFLLRGVTFE